VTLWILEPKKSGGGVALSPVLVPPSAHSYGSMGARLQF
jgi:hypothetical protein